MAHPYGYGVRFDLPLDQAVAVVTAALRQEGFGVLATIDIQATLKAKLDVDYCPYVILGACNPNLAYQWLRAEPTLGTLLPCNVILYDSGDGAVTVNVFDPIVALNVKANPAVKRMAIEANERLRNLLVQLSVGYVHIVRGPVTGPCQN